MSNAVDERIALIEKIIGGEIDKKGVQMEIQRIEKMYGSEAFPTFEFQKKEKPWNKEYFEELKNLCMSGAGSREFLLHLSEVRDSVSWRIKKIKNLIIGIFATVAIIGIIIGLINCFK